MAKYGLTKRAPDAGDSAPFSGIFLRLSLYLVGRLRRPAPAQVTQAVRRSVILKT